MCQPGRPRPSARLPGRLALTRRLPEQAVERVLLARPVGVSPALAEHREHRVVVEPRDLAEAGIGVHVEVQVVVDRVDRVAEALDEIHDEVDRLHGADVVARREHAQRLHVLAEQLGLALGERGPVLAGVVGPLEQRVVDVGDVLGVDDVEPAVEPLALEQVERQVGGRVAEVGGVVRGDAADVEAGDVRRGARDEGAGAGVVDAQLRGRSADRGDVRTRPAAHGCRAYLLEQSGQSTVAAPARSRHNGGRDHRLRDLSQGTSRGDLARARPRSPT